MHQITLRLPDAQYKKLKNLKEKTGNSINSIIRSAVQVKVDEE